jgi:hypothetical protein
MHSGFDVALHMQSKGFSLIRKLDVKVKRQLITIALDSDPPINVL